MIWKDGPGAAFRAATNPHERPGHAGKERCSVARASARILDAGDAFPSLEMETVKYGPLKLPEWFGGGWGVLLLFRGHW